MFRALSIWRILILTLFVRQRNINLIWCRWILSNIKTINPYLDNAPILYPLKTPDNQMLSQNGNISQLMMQANFKCIL